MKRIATLIACACLGFTALPAQAQNSNSSATSSSSASQQFSGSSTALAASQGGSVIIESAPATQTIRQSGSTTNRIESAPSLGGLAVGGGHPCAWTPSSAQISIIGGGGGYGAMQVDEACMLAVMAAASGSHQMQSAALMIIAGRDPAACKAMYMNGLVSDCVDKKGNSTVKPAPVVTSRNRVEPAAPKLWTSCRYDQASNKIMIKYTAAGRKSKTDTAIACQRSLGF